MHEYSHVKSLVQFKGCRTRPARACFVLDLLLVIREDLVLVPRRWRLFQIGESYKALIQLSVSFGQFFNIIAVGIWGKKIPVFKFFILLEC